MRRVSARFDRPSSGSGAPLVMPELGCLSARERGGGLITDEGYWLRAHSLLSGDAAAQTTAAHRRRPGARRLERRGAVAAAAPAAAQAGPVRPGARARLLRGGDGGAPQGAGEPRDRARRKHDAGADGAPRRLRLRALLGRRRWHAHRHAARVSDRGGRRRPRCGAASGGRVRRGQRLLPARPRGRGRVQGGGRAPRLAPRPQPDRLAAGPGRQLGARPDVARVGAAHRDAACGRAVRRRAAARGSARPRALPPSPRRFERDPRDGRRRGGRLLRLLAQHVRTPRVATASGRERRARARSHAPRGVCVCRSTLVYKGQLTPEQARAAPPLPPRYPNPSPAPHGTRTL